MRPKDFYFAQIIRTKDGSMVPLLVRLVQNLDVVNELPPAIFRCFLNWCVDNIFNENIFTVENWLEIAFHLSKQRWGPSVDWLEEQPMSKIRSMLDITERFVEAQNAAMKA